MLHLPSAGRDFRYGVGCLAGPARTSCSSAISCRPSKETNDLKERSTMKSRTTATLLLANIHATAVERMSACAEKARGELISSQLAWALCNRRYDPGDIPPITVAALDCGGFHTGAVEVARTGFPPTGSHPNLRAAARGPRPPARVSDSHKPWLVRQPFRRQCRFLLVREESALPQCCPASFLPPVEIVSERSRSAIPITGKK